MSGVIRWEDPPEHGNIDKPKAPRRTSLWRAAAAELRAHPGDWALVIQVEHPTDVLGMAGQIRAGRLVAFRPAGSFETRTVCRQGKLSRLYARYIGEPT